MADHVTMPRREPGLHLGPIDAAREQWECGCRTCGWWISGPYEEIRPLWLIHQHDPLHDIEERSADWRLTGRAADPLTLIADIEYLLWRLDEEKESRNG